MMVPIAHSLPPTRTSIEAHIPRRYSLAVHLGGFTLGGAALIVWACRKLGNLHAIELVTVPVVLLIGNFLEYVAHRWIMHRRAPVLQLAYEAHTRRHHYFFTSDRLTITDWREAWLVLFSTMDVAILVAIVAPGFYGLGYIVSPAVQALAIISAVVFFVGYEWLHLSYHLPEESFVARLPVLRSMRRYHRLHHELDRMRRAHFNVTVPIFDLLFGTYRVPNPTFEETKRS